MPDRTPMQEFINNICLVISLDKDEMGLSELQWQNFQNDPLWFLLKAGDGERLKIWQAIERRQ